MKNSVSRTSSSNFEKQLSEKRTIGLKQTAHKMHLKNKKSPLTLVVGSAGI